MIHLRRRLRLWVTAWIVFQAASLSAYVPRDCCAAHRPAAAGGEHAGHQPAAASGEHAGHHQAPAAHCPMRGADGRPCPMHEGAQPEDAPADDRTMIGSCGGPMAALVALLSTHGVLPDSPAVLPEPEPGAAAAHADERLMRRLIPPDSPPPRA